jgi:hypothetical protein
VIVEDSDIHGDSESAYSSSWLAASNRRCSNALLISRSAFISTWASRRLWSG